MKKQILASSGKIREAYKAYSAYFLNSEIQENIRNSKEEQFQEGFLRELFVKILGYTLNPEPDYNLITEKKNEKDSKKADGAILINGEVKAVIELKDHKTTDLKQVETQAFGYKNNNRKTSYVIISNFEKLRFYIENTIDFEEFNLYKLREDDFAVLWVCLAYENIAKDLPKQLKSESTNNEDRITKKLYKDYSTFKQALFDHIRKNNPAFDKLELFRKTQKLLDRFLFVFFAEDKGLLPPNSMKRIIDQWDRRNEDPLNEYQSLYERFKLYFKYMNEGHKGKAEDIFGYNGGLFKPDELLDAIAIDDDVLKENILKLIVYDFDTEVDVNILGHIFEHSLTEIEEITNEITTGAKQISKRKKDGVFYTPRYITAYIVENTLGKLCTDKKTALAIDESEYVADYKRPKAQTKQLADCLNTYREWLLSLSICDPACGSGAFLNAALDFLMAEHKYIDELTAKLFGSGIVFPDIENAILENNLYGIDINEESVEIAKLALWLRTAKPHRKLNSLNNNIKCGNSLISDPEIAGEKAFDWHKEFPQVFEKGGFDVVIGNPPYVNAIELKKTYSEKEYNFLKNNYLTAKGTVDLYIYFFERGLWLLNKKGCLAYITPNRYLSASYGLALREFIKTDFYLYQLIDYSDKKVFTDASTYPVITFLKNKESYLSYDIECGKFDETTKELISQKMNSNKLSLSADSIWGFLLNDKLTITQKVISKSCSLKETGLINATSTAKEADDYSTLINETAGYKLINTGTIDAYSNMWGISHLVDKGKKYLNPFLPKDSNTISSNRHKLYSSNKIIIAKIGLTCESFYDELGEYASINTNCIHSFSQDFLPEYILCWLNSKLYNYTFECLFDGLRMSGGYLLYSAPNLQNAYIYKAPKEIQEQFVSHAKNRANLSIDLQTKRQRFLKRLSDNFNAIKITGALEFFEKLEFKQFLAELAKQKITLSLKQQDEWEEYFNEYKEKCDKFVSQIQATDKAIDGMVYGLYGLTEEEIEIIERK
ncbi:MAG: Eco57I restriction-modification methylase domain-containing protein [Candidatus Azobacteroides sp.]|nr:Eco57I restriction-modification methylase domain-containing protein [Candidatus Azobacteroides sp.]